MIALVQPARPARPAQPVQPEQPASLRHSLLKPAGQHRAIPPLHACASALYDQALQGDAGQFRGWVLQQLNTWLDSDAAIWRRRHRGRQFHSVTISGLDRSFSQTWERSSDLNPVLLDAYRAPNRAIAFDATQPQALSSQLTQRVLPRFGICELMTIVVDDPVTQLQSELTLFRKEKQAFDEQARSAFEALAPLCVGAAKHGLLLSRIKPVSPHHREPTAIVDEAGRIYDAQDSFFAVLQEHFAGWHGGQLPFVPPQEPGLHTDTETGLNIYCEFWADLVLLRVWQQDPLDVLTDREREIALKIAEGWSYKIVAKHFDISPSTVSNHVTRLYQKLGISTRGALTALLNQA